MGGDGPSTSIMSRSCFTDHGPKAHSAPSRARVNTAVAVAMAAAIFAVIGSTAMVNKVVSMEA